MGASPVSAVCRTVDLAGSRVFLTRCTETVAALRRTVVGAGGVGFVVSAELVTAIGFTVLGAGVSVLFVSTEVVATIGGAIVRARR